MIRRIVICLLLFGLGTGCGGGSTSESDVGQTSDNSTLPDICEKRADAKNDCSGDPKKRQLVVCQGAPSSLILQNGCSYEHTSVGVGNVYCCP